MNSISKRVFDILLSVVALIIFGPLLIFVAILIKISSPGPVFFRQSRLGLKGAPFLIYKFRSMIINAPDLRNEDGSAFTSEEDPRVTKIGRFIRKTSIDEIPQCINVLLGHMSIVGPRPDQENQLQYYSKKEIKKLNVKPGMTGLAQISGRNTISWEDRKKLDIEYVDRQSFFYDLSIVLKTFPYVLLRKGINTEGRNE
jgi:undecaprenyl phosphate N,N'-diacetylbacillosamine 1-phosphate transferase